MLIYMCQDGEMPSGVATYGYAVLKNFPEARMLLLNARRPPPAAPYEVIDRIITLPSEVSHDVTAVTQTIAKLVAASKDKVILLPNTGDTMWTATWSYLREAGSKVRPKVRVLGIVHSDIDTQYHLAREYAAIAPIWVGVSRRCAEKLRVLTDSLATRVYELHYPVEVHKQEKAPSVDRPLRLIYAGRLEEPQKRVSRLVALFEELIRRRLRFRATVVGDGPDGVQFRKRLADAGSDVVRSVTVLGTLGHSDLDRLWTDQDIFILVSAYEGLPLALLEAMSAGVCPVVMEVCSGLPDLLEDGLNARMVQQGDITAMTDAIVDLDRDRDSLEKLCRAARRSVSIEALSPLKHFSKLRGIIKQCFQLPSPEIPSEQMDSTAAAVETICKRACKANRPVVIFGIGMFGRKVVDACLKKGIEVVALIDSDPEKIESEYAGLACFGPKKIGEFANVVFAVGSMQFDVEISNRIYSECKKAGISSPQVVTFRP